MFSQYIWSQIFVVLSYVVFALTYATSKRKILLFLSFVSLVLITIAYLLLSAYMGVAMSVFAMIRNVVFFVQNKDKDAEYTKVDYIILSVLIAVCCVFAGFTYNGVFSLLFPISTICYTVSVWQRSIPVYKILGIPTVLLSILYNIYIASMFGIICEGVFLVVVIIENIIFFTKSKQNTENASNKVEEDVAKL